MPSSAHPPGMMKGVIYGLLHNYNCQNTYKRDYNNIIVLTFNCHVARGWDRATMKDYILSADDKLHSHPTPTPTPTPSPSTNPEQELTNKECLFLHMEYHPNEIPRHQVRTIYTR